MTPQALTEFRARVPQCELAVYADIRSGTVLMKDGAIRYPQEYLDALSACAAQLFRDDPRFGDLPTDPILFFGPTGGRAFFRAPAEPNEALCCICGPDTAVDVLLGAGRAFLKATG